jgi:hypothetical protein
MVADVSGPLEQLLRSDAEVHGTRSFGSTTEPIDKLLQGGRHPKSRARGRSRRRCRLVWQAPAGKC